MRLTGFVCLLNLFSCSLWAASPQFSARQDTATGFTRLSGLVTADFNGDGRPDIAVTDSSAKRVVVYLANANGTLSAPVSTNVQFPAVGAGQMVTGDFNEDGKQDILLSTIAGAQSTILLTGNGDGTFTQQATLPNSFGFVSGQAIDVTTTLTWILSKGAILGSRSISETEKAASLPNRSQIRELRIW